MARSHENKQKNTVPPSFPESPITVTVSNPVVGRFRPCCRVGLGIHSCNVLGRRAEFPGLVAHKCNPKENEACNVFSSYLRTHLKPEDRTGAVLRDRETLMGTRGFCFFS